jgi:hypothetical protein
MVFEIRKAISALIARFSSKISDTVNRLTQGWQDIFAQDCAGMRWSAQWVAQTFFIHLH